MSPSFKVSRSYSVSKQQFYSPSDITPSVRTNLIWCQMSGWNGTLSTQKDLHEHHLCTNWSSATAALFPVIFLRIFCPSFAQRAGYILMVLALVFYLLFTALHCTLLECIRQNCSWPHGFYVLFIIRSSKSNISIPAAKSHLVRIGKDEKYSK